MLLMQLLSSHGASREIPAAVSTRIFMGVDRDLPRDAEGFVMDAALNPDGDETYHLDWLQESDAWTPLHHTEVLTAERTRALLRGGAALDAAAGTPPVTPLQRAREQLASSEAYNNLAQAAPLIVAAAQPWSPTTHDLFPTAARAHAVELARIGYLLAWSGRFQSARSLIDCWVHRPEGGSVLSCAVTRDAGGGGAGSSSG